ncbi:unnamed protein product, partial [Ectocarpus fasciculatus]
EALGNIDFDEVKTDIVDLIHSSEEWWPADWQSVGGSYGPFFIRLAWHCSGSYRTSDGRGGCDGGRQRFNPEQSWEDNANLDKARELLWPVKQKYGEGLSWGDLFVLAGTTAIEDMGGPIIGFCAGRIDDSSGAASAPLGPTQYQEDLYPCELNGNCSAPLGSEKVGLIYVDPTGHLGNPDPALSVADIRDVFGRMAMNDTETVALIGGGHAFGKAHGACPNGAGPNPFEDPENPWPGECGTGKGNDTWTSGIEGPWTTTPTVWDNQYFHNLLNYTWEKYIGPGGAWQWRVSNESSSQPPSPIMMMTTDLALLEDANYLELVQRFSEDKNYLEEQFAHAWYKLTTRDVGPVTRCFGNDVPPPQPFQYPLPGPIPQEDLVNFNSVKQYLIDNILYVPNTAVLGMDEGGYGPLFVRLAWQCANTFRQTDHMGGCNGARIRFPPQSEWEANVILNKALDLLQPVVDYFGEGLSWADLIVLAGTTALEESNSLLSIPFQGGRVDAFSSEDPTPQYLENRLGGGEQNDDISSMKDVMLVWGLSPSELVALVGGGHSLGRMHQDRSGFPNGTWTSKPDVLDNEFFVNLKNLDWVQQWEDTNLIYYNASNENGIPLQMLRTDMNMVFDAEFRAIVEEYATNEEYFYAQFVSAWEKMMNADTF